MYNKSNRADRYKIDFFRQTHVLVATYQNANAILQMK